MTTVAPADIQRDDDGNLLLQLPVLQAGAYHSQLWISRTGVVRRRYYNQFTEGWTWGPIVHPRIHWDGSAVLHYGPRSIKLSRAIRCAWRRGGNNECTACSFAKDERGGPSPSPDGADGSSYHPSSSSSEDELDVALEDEEGSRAERWEPLRVSGVETEYEVSSEGHFRDGAGKCLRVHTQPRARAGRPPRRVLCLEAHGVLDVDAILASHFGSVELVETSSVATTEEREEAARRRDEKNENADGREDNVDALPPRLKRLYAALERGVSLIEYARANALAESTVWSYVYDLFVRITNTTSRVFAASIVDAASYRAMRRVFECQREDVFSLSAREYMPIIERIMRKDEPDWATTPTRFYEIRLLKLICGRHVREERTAAE